MGCGASSPEATGAAAPAPAAGPSSPTSTLANQAGQPGASGSKKKMNQFSASSNESWNMSKEEQKELREFIANGATKYSSDADKGIAELVSMKHKDFDLCDLSWEKHVRQAADVVLKIVGPANLDAQIAKIGPAAPPFARTCLLFAKSKAAIASAPGELHISSVAVAPAPTGVGARAAQLQWLVDGASSVTWSLVVVDGTGEPSQVEAALAVAGKDVGKHIKSVRSAGTDLASAPFVLGLYHASTESVKGTHLVALLDPDGASSAAGLGVLVGLSASGAGIVVGSRAVPGAVSSPPLAVTPAERLSEVVRHGCLPSLAGVSDLDSHCVVAPAAAVKATIDSIKGSKHVDLAAVLGSSGPVVEGPVAFVVAQPPKPPANPGDLSSALASVKTAAASARSSGANGEGGQGEWLALADAMSKDNIEKVVSALTVASMAAGASAVTPGELMVAAGVTPTSPVSPPTPEAAKAEVEAAKEEASASAAAAAPAAAAAAAAAPAAAAAAAGAGAAAAAAAAPEEPAPAAEPEKPKPRMKAAVSMDHLADMEGSPGSSLTGIKFNRKVISDADLAANDEMVHSIKELLRKDWERDYVPESVKPPTKTIDTLTERATRVSLPMIVAKNESIRKTKIICTMGPKCWDEESLGKLLDAGLGIARFNFSHGSHEDHGAVLERFRKVCAEKGSHAAALLDTKGPEIRTAMLKDHTPIDLVADQEIIIKAVGDKYTEFEGYKNDEETVIGLSYAKLCESVNPGSRILCADGTISIEVVEIVDGETVKGKVMNTKTLGERKNCNLPGVKVDIPVLTDKDINDLQNWGCKNMVDFVAASFVQTAEDVQFIRKTLDDAGGQHIKIISKIENEEGLVNFDDILKYTDGVMVARGDLGMEIPSEKVPAAQKMLITKSNLAGKLVVCATQMLESMITNPLPTRAEMTDVANAVFDGADCTMLSGETANGSFPAVAVDTMARIAMNAELGVDYESQYQFIRSQVTENNVVKILAAESCYSAVAKTAVEFMEDTNGDGVVEAHEGAVAMVITTTGAAADLISKYRPPCPILVVSSDKAVLRQTNARYAQYPFYCEDLSDTDAVVLQATQYMRENELSHAQRPVIVCHGVNSACADKHPCVKVLSSAGKRRQSFAGGRGSAARTITGMPLALPGTVSMRSTAINMDLISKPLDKFRATKILCTMGPKCWDEESLEKLLDAGLNIARFNFSHGSHEDHGAVLERYRAVCAKKGAEMKEKLGLPTEPYWGALLDTKGPEIRTAMLKDHTPIDLVADQEIFIEAVGDKYTEFEGYKNDEETVIGLSYAKLCSSVSEGSRILCADGTISIEVVEIVSDTRLKGKVMNTKTLGERKNCNLPGVKVDIPVLTDKDINDLQNWACKHKVDYVAASFVQTAEDVQFIRKTLDDAGGQDIKIISKIENEEGLNNFDDILKYTDGVMVARGDLGMEIPSEKVTLAQKMLITKSNLAGKFVVCATQMLESMITNPLPTRAEMTDVANAVFDGADAVMLSGETANGSFPDVAVRTMASIVTNAEEACNNKQVYDFIRRETAKPVEANEAVCSAAVQAANDVGAKILIVVSQTDEAVLGVSKYRPEIPTIVMTNLKTLAVHCNSSSGQFGMYYEETFRHVTPLIPDACAYAKGRLGVDIQDGDAVVLVHNRSAEDNKHLAMRVVVVGEAPGATKEVVTEYPGELVISYRSTRTGLDTILDDKTFEKVVRKTKILCTMGPKCWDEETIGRMLDAGLGIARFNFSHGSHEDHGAVLERYRKVCAEKGSHSAALLDTKGPEIRTAMLKDHTPIDLVADQEIIIKAVGDKYTEFEGYKNDEETVIGLSYAKLCESVKPGNVILCADGTISIEVVEVVDGETVKGKVMNNKTLGERKNCNLPGVKVDIPVLTDKDVNDLQNWACKHKVDFVAASFVQTAEDVQFIRKILDDAGGQHIKIISKIENAEGLINFDDILKYTDGVMVARGDLGMEIPSEKVALAQKWMTTKCNIAGKFVVCATQMLESMIGSILPTRAEMTDVANAVFDGVDAVMLSGETANGCAPANAVGTMARIARSAELGTSYSQAFDFIREFTPKPVGTVESFASTAAKNAIDVRPGMIVVFSEGGKTARLVAKYRPSVPVLLVTASPELARSVAGTFAMYPMLLDAPVAGIEEIPGVVEKALHYGVDHGFCSPGKEVLVLQSTANIDPGKRESGAVGPVREMYFRIAPGTIDPENLGALAMQSTDHKMASKTVSIRSTRISLANLLSPVVPARKTKIAATLGPKCWSEDGIAALLDNGMDVARFTFDGPSVEENATALEIVRRLAKERGRVVATMMDLTGPSIRTTAIKGGGASISVEPGQEVKLVPSEKGSFESYSDESETKIGVHYGSLLEAGLVGTRVKLDDGAVVLRVDAQGSGELVCTVLMGEKILPNRMVWLGGSGLPGLDALTPEDKEVIVSFGIKNAIDFVACSFVQGAGDVGIVRQFLMENEGSALRVVSKIETIQGLINHDEIIEISDGVMVARGDLGNAIMPEKVSLAQKMLVTKCNVANKFVMCAKQMLESMCTNPLPTRAEMTDVANAVLDGADVVMLSAETAAGDFPAKAVRTMSQIARNAELATNFYSYYSFMRDMSHKPFGGTESCASSACKGAIDTGAAAIIMLSDTGRFARLVSKYRPPVPIIAVTTKLTTARMLACCFGVYPMLIPEFGTARGAIKSAVMWAKKLDVYTEGPLVVVHGLNSVSAEKDPVLRMVDSADEV